MKKVLVVIPTADKIESCVIDSINSQDYGNFNLFVNRIDPINKYPDRRNISFNSTRNLNDAKVKALYTDADYFLLVDSDVSIPKDAISKLMVQTGPRKTTIPVLTTDGKLTPNGTPVDEKHIIGGWYKMVDDVHWVAGMWIGDNILFRFKSPQQSLIKVDMVGLGCLLLSRKALKELNFIDGTSLFARDEYGNSFYIGPCAAFSNNAQDKGYSLWMDGDVICEHLRREDKAYAA